VTEEIFPISARLIANKSAYRFKGEEIIRVAETVKGALDL
jgi:ATP phosphoribosyltransferase